MWKIPLEGRVFSVNINPRKGEPKNMVREAFFQQGHGIEGDAHAGPGARQVSLLAIEDIEDAQDRCDKDHVDLPPGIFAENITTEGMDLSYLSAGDVLWVGEEVVLKVSQIGKDCHGPCAVFRQIGSCVMPQKGVFATVERGGHVKVRDVIRLERRISYWSALKKDWRRRHSQK